MGFPEVITLLLIGLVAGFIGAAFGLGGGIIIVPALIFFMGLTQHQAQGTSLGVLVFPVAILGAFNYYKSGYINVKFILILALAFVVGGYLGSLFSISLSEKLLKKIFGIFILLVSLKMIFEK